MKICIPVERDNGLESQVYGHFGSAPCFIMVDTESLTYHALSNNDQQHAHGMCQPVAVLNGEQVDGIVVGGIGMGALMKLNASGYQVFQSRFPTVKETVDAYKKGQLPVFTPQQTCGGGHGHGPGPGCSH